MGKMNRESQGDGAPSQAAYLDIGRFRLTPNVPGKIGIRDMVGGEWGPFNEAKLEAALLQFFSEEF